MVSNSELRRRARQQLGGGIFEGKWMMALLVGMVFSAITNGLSTITYGLASIFLGCFVIGYTSIFMGIARGKQAIDIGELFIGFKGERLTKSLVLQLLIGIYTFLWSLLFVIPGIVKVYSYSMAFYIMNDHPEFTATQCLDESRRIMNGHKLDLFCLHLSFIGWILLSAFTFGLGMLWITPYMKTSEANFYEELKIEQGEKIIF